MNLQTTRAFLPDMIKQQRGHIVGISSCVVQCPFHGIVTYTAAKYANKGFIDGLREEMCYFGFDKFIKVSTAFPGYTWTNDKHAEFFKTFTLYNVFMFSEAKHTAEEIVKGILKDDENIYISNAEYFGFRLINALPRYLKTKIGNGYIRKHKQKEFMEMRLRGWKLKE